MLLSRVHWATHLFWPHTLRNRMIFPRKNWKCTVSVFNQTGPSLMAAAPIPFTQLGGGRENTGKDVHGWPNTLALVFVSLTSQGESLWKDFGDLWRAGWISQSGFLCISVRWPSWLSQELVSAWSISYWEATTFLAGRHQSVVNPPCPLVRCYYLMYCN